MQNKNALLKELFQKQKGLVYNVALKILNDKYLAEDAVQTTFLKLFQNKFEIDDINCNKTKVFIVIICRSVAYDILRKKKREKTHYLEDVILPPIDPAPSPLEKIIDNDDVNAIVTKIQDLDPKYADVLALKYLYTCSNSEISDLLSISEQNVRVRLHRAKNILVSELAQGGVHIAKK